MCGRYGFSIKDEREFLDRFDIETVNFELQKDYANWNVAPTQEMPVIERHSPNSLHLRKWGIKPSWAYKPIINAQAEKLDTSKVWSKPFIEGRVIIPANYFFEWKILENGKQPYLIRLKSQGMFGFAGLVATYHDEKKEEKTGYIIITTEPNEIMKPIHKRMPVILNKDDEDKWLNPDTDPLHLKSMLQPYTPSEMEVYPVASLVNKPSNNFPEITKKI